MTNDELYSHITEQGYDVSEERMKAYFWDNYETLDREKRGSPSEAINEKLKFSLTVESTFRLIEYEEFKSANKRSRIATYFATAALVVSIFSAGASIHFSKKQLNTATTINEPQLTELLQLKYDGGNINKKIEEIISYQKLLLNERKKNKGELLNQTKKPNKKILVPR